MVWWLAGCTTEDPPAVVAPPPAEVAPAAASGLPVSDAPAPGPDAPWRGAWPLGDGSWVPGPGRLIHREGVVEATDGAPCAGGVRVPGAGVVWMPPGPALVIEEAAAVPASTVERAAWRVAEALGPSTRVQPGGRADHAPAAEDGALVRTARKTRVEGGPPVLATVGERDGRVAAMLLDKVGGVALAAVVFEAAPGTQSSALPVLDLDGDGTLDWIVYGTTPEGGGYRASIAVSYRPEPTLRLVTIERRQAPPTCP